MLQKVFDKHWSDLQSKINSLLEQYKIKAGMKTADDWYRYAAVRVRDAVETIDDASLSSRRTWPTDSDAAEKYYQIRKDTINSGRLRYRYIAAFNDSHDKPRLEMLEEYLDNYGKGKNFWAGVFPPADRSPAIPLLNLVIIDDKEAIVSFFSDVAGEHDRTFVVQRPEGVALFRDYYRSLWLESLKLITKEGTDKSPLSEIRNSLRVV